MTLTTGAISKIPTDSPQPARRAAKSPGRPRRAPGTDRSPALVGATGRASPHARKPRVCWSLCEGVQKG
jgi:hypothetical protein